MRETLSARVYSLSALVTHGLLFHRIGNEFRRRRGLPRKLLPAPVPNYGGTWSSRRINALLALRSTRFVRSQYLEVGIQDGMTFEAIGADWRQGVDPQPGFDLASVPSGCSIDCGISDDFFRALCPEEQYDVVFLDGLHDFHQTFRDLTNAMCHLRSGGFILIDDTIPFDAHSARPLSEVEVDHLGGLVLGGPWHGDVWKIVSVLATLKSYFTYHTIVDDGNGQTIVWQAEGVSQKDAPTALLTVDLQPFDTLKYSTVFAHGSPASMNLLLEVEVFEIAAQRDDGPPGMGQGGGC